MKSSSIATKDEPYRTPVLTMAEDDHCLLNITLSFLFLGKLAKRLNKFLLDLILL